MRLTVLWTRLAGYSAAFLRQLAERGWTLQLSYFAEGGDLRFEPFDTSFCQQAVQVTPDIPRELAAAVEEFAPDALLMSGWNFAGYMRIARAQRRRGVPVVAAADNPWRGTWRQHAMSALAPLWLHPVIDALYVCGEPQLEFARRLRFRNTFAGLYAAEVERFAGLPPLATRQDTFLFVGRLIERKGVPALLEAYARYRAAVTEPMGLRIAGDGPLADVCKGRPGVELCGFLQPDDLPAFFASGQCLILPSVEENWGVVLHEAAAAGLPVVASEACGATTAYLRHGANGFLISPQVGPLTQALVAFHQLGTTQRQAMSELSRELGKAWSPALQAEQFACKLRTLLNRTARQPD